MMIEIKKSLRFEDLPDGLLENEKIFKRYYDWLQEEFPGQKLKLCSSTIKKRTEAFLLTESKLSSLWLYFMLNHNKTKVIFRNPHGYKEETKVVFQA